SSFSRKIFAVHNTQFIRLVKEGYVSCVDTRIDDSDTDTRTIEAIYVCLTTGTYEVCSGCRRHMPHWTNVTIQRNIGNIISLRKCSSGICCQSDYANRKIPKTTDVAPAGGLECRIDIPSCIRLANDSNKLSAV